MLLVVLCLPLARADELEPTLLDYQIEVETVLSQKGNNWHWFLPFVAPIPNAGKDDSVSVVAMIMKHLVTSDHYSGPYTLRSADFGRNWTKPKAPFGMGWKTSNDGTTMAISDMTPGYHAPSGKVLAIGGRVRHDKKGNQVLDKPRSEEVVYSVYDTISDEWTPLRTLSLPDTDTTFFLAISSCGQWLVKDDGSLLIPIYFRGASESNFSTVVLHCSFDGATLKYLEHGNRISLDVSRGAYEPSLARYRDRYFLTIRNDKKGYVTTGADGLHYNPITPWTFDDGTELGSYNTQQHWLSHSNGLFLVYTRKGANNDNVMRHRAPLFIAQVDPTKLCVIRRSERILIPNGGLPLGNFGATAITRAESWVTVAESVTPGSPNKVYLARVIWSTPNRTVDNAN